MPTNPKLCRDCGKPRPETFTYCRRCARRYTLGNEPRGVRTNDQERYRAARKGKEAEHD